jgi:hypothetical protein
MVRFDPELSRESVFHLDEHPPQGMAPGPCGMGPTGGETIHSMHVWVFQNVVGGVALASGDSREQPEFTAAGGEHRWRVPTSRDPRSKEFTLDQPAAVVGIAIVGDGDRTEVREWSQAVTIVRESHFPGRTPPPPN